MAKVNAKNAPAKPAKANTQKPPKPAKAPKAPKAPKPDKTQQPPKTARRTREPGSSLAAWMVVLFIAAGGFGASVWYSGGVAGAMDLVTTSDYSPLVAQYQSVVSQSQSLISGLPFIGSGTPATTSVAATSSAETPNMSSVLASATEELFALQMSAQTTLTALAEGRIRDVQIGPATVESDSASVAYTIDYVGAPVRETGKVYLVRSGTAWLVTRPDVGSRPATPGGTAGVDRSVVAAFTQQQIQRQNQRVIQEGALQGGFKTVGISRVTKTATGVSVDLTFSGGSWVVGFGRVTLDRRIVGSRTYWFLTSIDEP